MDEKKMELFAGLMSLCEEDLDAIARGLALLGERGRLVGIV